MSAQKRGQAAWHLYFWERQVISMQSRCDMDIYRKRKLGLEILQKMERAKGIYEYRHIRAWNNLRDDYKNQQAWYHTNYKLQASWLLVMQIQQEPWENK